MMLQVNAQSGYFNQTSLSKDDAVILNEEINYEVSGKKLNFIQFIISKNILIDLKSQKAIDYFSNYRLTQNEDPLEVVHAPKARNFNALFSELKVNYFKAKRQIEEGDYQELDFVSNFKEVESSSVTDDFYDVYYDIYYQIDGLEIGDKLLIEWSYTVPYAGNFYKLTSNRFFFNSNVYKEKTQVTLSHHKDLKSEVKYYFGAKPDTIIEGEDFYFYQWKFDQLEGNIFEVGSRAYQELPHVVYSLFPYDLLYTFPNSFREEFIPYYSMFSYLREKKFVSLLASAYQGVNNKQFSQVRKYIDAVTNELPDTIAEADKAKAIHNDIALNFKFSDDIDYFKQRDTRNPRMGDYITAHSIRDIKRYDVYAFILFELKNQFYTVYLADNRYAEITFDYFKPMAQSDYLFGMMADDRIHFLYPKKSRFGYLFGEIPFYFQNASARFVHLSDYRAYEQPINTEMRKLNMPNSGIFDNIRKTNALVTVSLEKNILEFNARISLSGQYSTMTRGVYQYHEKDETVNPLYNQKIWEDIVGVSDTSAQVDLTNKDFPFNAQVNASFTSSEILQNHQDTLSIDLANWFKHVIYPNMEIDNRSLDFYPDFQGRDTYVYFLKFDQEINLLNDFEEVSIHNSFGELDISMVQMDSKSIKISSSFASISPKIEAQEISTVGEIYQNIEQLNTARIQFLLKK
jgi:hypothetical protein